jgi:hypothetical protein
VVVELQHGFEHRPSQGQMLATVLEGGPYKSEEHPHPFMKGELQNHRGWHKSQRYISEKNIARRIGRLGEPDAN